jgi:hypothetical protein
MLQTIGVAARPRPATMPRIVDRVRTRTRSTVSAQATPTRIAERRFIRNAASPSGVRTIDASQPSRTYVG